MNNSEVTILFAGIVLVLVGMYGGRDAKKANENNQGA